MANRGAAGVAGYSGTPLRHKIGVADGQRTLRHAMPAQIATEIDGDGPPPDTATPPWDMVHLFCDRRDELAAMLLRLRAELAPAGMIWVSWPKRASKMPTDITEDTIRALALPLGFVDVKVCAVDAIWSGLKLVVRKVLR
ncbi:MAG: hypothetical protein ACRCUI_04280 [Polymorphobacter sp.]